MCVIYDDNSFPVKTPNHSQRINWIFLFSDGEAQASLRNVLIFSTGADSPPPIGFENQPTIEFIDRELPKSNTCAPTLYLPLEINEYEKFKAQMDFGILNSPRFGYA